MTEQFRLKLKVITPVHIGSGETLTRIDYWFDNKRFCRVNLDSLFADPDFAPLRDKFTAAAPNGEPVERLVPAELLRRHVGYRLRVAPAAKRYLDESRRTEVKTVIKSAGRVYIPGSSLKGAMLTALCWDMFTPPPAGGPQPAHLLTGSGGGDLLSTVLPALGGTGSGQFTRWLDVSDPLEYRAPADCLALSLVDVKKPPSTRDDPRAGRRGKDLRLLCETIQKNNEFTYRLTFPAGSKLTAGKLLDTVNRFYQEVARADRLNSDDAGLKLPATGLVRLGSGSGAYAVSMLLAARQLGVAGYRVRPPRSRKRAGEGNIPLGWAQLTLEDG